MNNVISLCEFREKKNTKLDLKWAKEYLEDDLYNQALNIWSIEELKRTIFQAEMYPTMAYEAYQLILEKRLDNKRFGS